MSDAVIVDVDGTLCNVRSALVLLPDFAAFHRATRRCPPTPAVIDWCATQHKMGRTLVVVTGRKYEHEQLTRDWLDEHLPLPYVGPFMRGDRDDRADTDVKRDIFAQLHDDHGYNVVAAIDDRPSILRLWSSELGIPTTAVHRADWVEAGEPYDLLHNVDWIEQ